MSQENAKKFLKKVASDPTVLKSVQSSLHGSVVKAGESNGFQFTAEELKEVASSLGITSHSLQPPTGGAATWVGVAVTAAVAAL
jgi:predicted ribosomally synthesized peptide with nif11-like leader